MPTEILLLLMVKAVAELAFFFLLGRGLLYLLAGRGRRDNLFYQILRIVTDPVIRAARWLTPRLVLDAHIPLVAVLLVVWVWLGIVFWALPSMCAPGRYDCTALYESRR